jgi:putative hemolysin
MIEALLSAAAFLFLLGSAVYCGSEMGMYSLNRIRLRLEAEKPEAGGARALLKLMMRRDETVMGILLWQNICGYLITVVFSFWLATAVHVQETHVEFYSAVILSPLMFVIGDVVPKNWFQVEADRLMYRVGRFLKLSIDLLRYTGILWVLTQISRLVARYFGEEQREDWLGTRGEVVGLLREGAAEGLLSEEQTQIVERVMDFSRVQVRSIMIPRRRAITVPINATRREFETIVRLHPFSRLPVMARDGRRVVGAIQVTEALADESGFSIEKWMHPPLFLSGTDTAATALVHLQRQSAAMAIVQDQRQTFIGVLTLKDVVEEIFGELPAW